MQLPGANIAAGSREYLGEHPSFLDQGVVLFVQTGLTWQGMFSYHLEQFDPATRKRVILFQECFLC